MSTTSTGGEGSKLCIDLCCGRKGFSRAFAEAGWEVVTVDIDPRFEPKVKLDLTKSYAYGYIAAASQELSFRRYSKVVVVASPPCNSNSKANAMAWLKEMGNGLRVAAACTDIIYNVMAERDPQRTYFALENPEGRLRWFMGTPSSVVRLKNFGAPTSKPTYLYHNIQFRLLEGDAPKDGEAHKQRKDIHKVKYYDDPTKSADMSSLSQAILEAVEQP